MGTYVSILVTSTEHARKVAISHSVEDDDIGEPRCAQCWAVDRFDDLDVARVTCRRSLLRVS